MTVSRTVAITNRRGLHARASAKFVTLASQQAATIEVEKDGSKVTGTSIMGLMMLGAAMGDSVIISATGDDAEGALDRLATLVEAKFGKTDRAPRAMLSGTSTPFNGKHRATALFVTRL